MSNKGESRYLKGLENDFPGYRQQSEVFGKLTEKQLWVLSLRCQGKTLAHIAKIYRRKNGSLGCTRAFIREIESGACRRIRYALNQRIKHSSEIVEIKMDPNTRALISQAELIAQGLVVRVGDS